MVPLSKWCTWQIYDQYCEIMKLKRFHSFYSAVSLKQWFRHKSWKMYLLKRLYFSRGFQLQTGLDIQTWLWYLPNLHWPQDAKERWFQIWHLSICLIFSSYCHTNEKSIWGTTIPFPQSVPSVNLPVWRNLWKHTVEKSWTQTTKPFEGRRYLSPQWLPLSTCQGCWGAKITPLHTWYC